MCAIFFSKSEFEKSKRDEEALKKKADSPVLSENPKTPDSNLKAKAVAADKTEEAKKAGKKSMEKAKAGEEKKESKDFKVKLFGTELIRKSENGEVFYLDSSGKKLTDLAKWASDKLKDATVTAKLERDLKPYSGKLEAVTPEQRAKSLKDLNSKSILDLQNGADSKGQIKGDKIELAALRAQAVLEKKSGSTFSVTDNLSKVKNNKYLDYQHVLPPNATTIIVERAGEKFVCVRMIDRTEGERIGYFNLQSGKRVPMQKGDTVSIVGTIDTKSAQFNQVVEQENSAISKRAKTGFAYSKDKEKPYKISGKHGGRGSYIPRTSSYVSSGATPSQSTAPSTPSAKPSSEKWDPSKNESKEVAGEYNIKTVKNPEINGGRNIHLFIPEKLDPKKPTHIIYYFHGFTNPAGAAKELLTNPREWSKKHMLSGLKDLAKTHNIVFAMPEGESGRSKWWSLQKKDNFNRFDEFVRKESGADKTKDVKRYIMGHSGAYIALNGILRSMPANYFAGLGLFDTIYGKGMYTQEFFKRLSKHDKMKVWSLFQGGTSSPTKNNNALQKMLQNDPGARKAEKDMKFSETTLGHTDIKAPGIRDSMKFFLENEKKA